MGNDSLGTFPVDCAASHNNNRGAIRYANPSSDATVVTVWNLNTTTVPPTPLGTIGGPGVKSGAGTFLSLSPFTYQPSDRVKITNTDGVSIGSGESAPFNGLDETYIEVFNLTAPIALNFPQEVQTASTGDPLYPYIRGGKAHDVEITRDSQWAVVNSDNWIHVVHIPSNTVHEFNIGLLDYTVPNAPVPWQSGPPIVGRACTPNYAVDSVAVTNDRAVVTTARESTVIANAYTTWVYLIDLSDPMATGTPLMLLQHEILPPPQVTSFPDEYGDWPHDVAVTGVTETESGPDPMAVVTTRHSVASYNLDRNAFVKSFYDLEEEEQRDYQWQVDSVEVTRKVAVVISDRVHDLGGGATSLIWRIRIFRLDNNGGITQLQTYTGEDSENDDRAHDLLIASDEVHGLVRTSFHNFVIQNATSPPPPAMALAPIPSSSNAHGYHGYIQATQYAVFSSDSVAIGTFQDDSGTQRLMAATIGSEAPLGIWSGLVDLIDLNSATPTILGPVPIASNPNSPFGCVPTDLAISYDQSEVVVRSTDPWPEAFNASGPDLTRIQILPTASIGTLFSYGGHGSTLGLDSLAVPPLSGFIKAESARRKLSIAQDEFLSSGGVDYVLAAN